MTSKSAKLRVNAKKRDQKKTDEKSSGKPQAKTTSNKILNDKTADKISEGVQISKKSVEGLDFKRHQAGVSHL